MCTCSCSRAECLIHLAQTCIFPKLPFSINSPAIYCIAQVQHVASLDFLSPPQPNHQWGLCFYPYENSQINLLLSTSTITSLSHALLSLPNWFLSIYSSPSSPPFT